MSAKEKGRGEKTVLEGLTLSCSRSTQFYGMKRDLNSIFSVVPRPAEVGKLPVSGRVRCPSLRAADGAQFGSLEAPSALRVKAVADRWINALCLQGTNALFFFFSFFFSLPLAPSVPTLGLQMTAVGHLTKCPLDCCFTTGAPSDQTAHRRTMHHCPSKLVIVLRAVLACHS